METASSIRAPHHLTSGQQIYSCETGLHYRIDRLLGENVAQCRVGVVETEFPQCGKHIVQRAGGLFEMA